MGNFHIRGLRRRKSCVRRTSEVLRKVPHAGDKGAAGLKACGYGRYGAPPPTLAPGEFQRATNPEIYQSFNPLFVILFTPLVVAFFQWLVNRGGGLSTARKIFLGLVLTTLSLLVMAAAGALSDDGSVKVSSLWLVGFYAIVTLGELCLSPMGLSLVTKLTPKRLVGLAMGGWFMATAFGNNFSGFFGVTVFAPATNAGGDALFVADVSGGSSPRGLFLYRRASGTVV